MRSAVSIAAAEPSMSRTGPPSRQSPSAQRRSRVTSGSSAAKAQLGRLQAEDHAGGLLGDARPRAGPRRDGRARGHVARADVLLQGPADDVLDDLGVERRHAGEDMRVVRAAGPG